MEWYNANKINEVFEQEDKARQAYIETRDLEQLRRLDYITQREELLLSIALENKSAYA